MNTNNTTSIPERYVAYHRTSRTSNCATPQGAEGLGLAAQAASVQRFIQARPNARILKTFSEVMSGGRDDRPQLQAACGLCRRTGATLLISRMDRLTRSLSLLESLKLSGVKFTMADMPMVTEAIVPILMAIGSYEREILRTRTREALAALKAKGVALGSSRSGHWTGREALRLAGQAKATKKAVTARRQKMIERYGDLQPRIVKMRTDGMTYAAIAETLNAETREFLSEAEMTGAVRFDVMKVRRISNMVMAA